MENTQNNTNSVDVLGRKLNICSAGNEPSCHKWKFRRNSPFEKPFCNGV